MPRITEIRYMRQIRRLLQWFPHNIQISLHTSGLLVTWEYNEAETVQRFDEEHCGADAELLHFETGNSIPPFMCDQIELSSKASTEIEFAAWRCRQQFVHRKIRWCVFAELDHSTAYYATVCLNERSAIYGLPSEKLSILSTSTHDNGLVLCDPAALPFVGIHHGESPMAPTSPAPSRMSRVPYRESCKRLKVSHS
ncbi:hypothetical protein N7451_012148 [Penicillium sp. IBT 35674x]|nr:hypothetical protein N7451_012148 [Penicillium sp. IBT 35674x]